MSAKSWKRKPNRAPNRSLRLRWSEKLQKMPPDSLQSIIDTTFTEISRASDSFTPQLTPREAGTITSVATGIAKIAGLPWVGSEELVRFSGDLLGIAFNLADDATKCVAPCSEPLDWRPPLSRFFMRACRRCLTCRGRRGKPQPKLRVATKAACSNQ